MTRLKPARSSLFLIELIIAILFFSAGSAVCVRAFAQAHLMSQAASDLSFASAQVSSAASVIRYTDGSPEAVSVYLPGAAAVNTDGVTGASGSDDPAALSDGQTCAVYYDSSRQPCSREEAAYTLLIHTSQEGIRTDARLSMTGPDGTVIYELDLRYPSEHTGTEGGSAHES